MSNYLDKVLELLLIPHLIQRAAYWNGAFDGLHWTVYSFVYIKQPFSILPERNCTLSMLYRGKGLHQRNLVYFMPFWGTHSSVFNGIEEIFFWHWHIKSIFNFLQLLSIPKPFILDITAGCILYIWLPNQTVPNILWDIKPSVPGLGPQIYLHVAYFLSWRKRRGALY